MNEKASYAPRSRKAVKDLTHWLDGQDPKQGKTRKALLKDCARVRNLPSLLRRNGLLQTLLFLQSKGEKSDGERLLWNLLKEHLSLGDKAAAWAEIETPRYLRLNEQAIEIATLLSRLLDAEAAIAEAEKEQTQ